MHRATLIAAFAICGTLHAQSSRPLDRLVRSLNEVPTTSSLAAFHVLLGSEPHVAGTAGDERTIERLRESFVQMGLPTVVEEFWALLPHPQDALLEIVTNAGPAAPPTDATESSPATDAPVRRGVIPLSIVERNLLEDPASAHPGLNYGWNAFSGNGDVTAEVVYANYGTKADFEQLRAQGVDVKGKLVIARYGGNFRGYKWKFAEQAGAVGLLIFTDPADAGDKKGKTYPEGGWANETCIQRGSILALDYPGDPLTPFDAATEETERLDAGTLALPRIPVQPIGYAAAAQIMSRMTGEPVKPETKWSGGMPIEYRIVGGPELRVHLRVAQDRQVRRSANVIAAVKGRTNPDQYVVVGCHHDAWGFGAADPLAGTIVLMECARSFAAAAARGERPDRTVIFAAWGAEEYGIIGSTEWVEGHRAQLASGAVAYINLDMAAMGTNFGASCSPSLHEVILSATVRVPQAQSVSGETVYDRISGGGRNEPKFGDLGGGSDHIAFNCHVGVASMSLGSGGSQGSSYHSNYDTIAWYRKVVGADYEPALMLTRMTNAAVGLLADTPVVPLSAARHGRDSVRVLHLLRAQVAKATPADAASLAALDALLARATSLAERGAQLDAALASAMPTMSKEQCRAASDALIALDRAWVDEQGLEGRPWFRSLLAASDRDSGYASVMLPLLTEAVETQQAPKVQMAAGRYGQVFDRLDKGMELALKASQPFPPKSDTAPVTSSK